MNFPYKEQAGGGEAWSLDHLGEVIQYQGTRPVDSGICPTCHKRLYVGNPISSSTKRGPIPLHPNTASRDNQTVLGRPWVKLTVRASAGDLQNWYIRQLPQSGWVIVDSTRVSQDSFMVITDGIKSKWMKIAPVGVGNSEIIIMSRF